MASSFPCPEESCPKRHDPFKSKQALKIHYDIEHAGVRYPCDTCGEQFKSKRSRDGHNKSKHLGMKNWRQSKNLKCTGCSKTFADKQNLERHIRDKHSKENFPCRECDLIFSSPEKLKYHVERKHEGLRFVCIDCGEGFASMQILRRHIDDSPLCLPRKPKNKTPVPVERKRKLGEVDKTAAALFLESIPDKIKNSSAQECLHQHCTKERGGYGFMGGDHIYCIDHQNDQDGVINLGALNLCVYKGCVVRGHNTVKNTKGYSFCAPHRDELISAGLPRDEVIFEKNKQRCKTPGCDVIPAYDDRQYCKAHSPTGISDDKRKCSMACCNDGGPRPTYTHPDNGTAICAFGARVLMEDALMHDDIERSRELMHHFKRSSMLVLNQQSAFRISMEQLYWKLLDTCVKVSFDDTVSGKPKTRGDLRPDIFYIWEVGGKKMAIHIEYDEGKGQHEDNVARLQWIAEASRTLGRVYVIRVDGRSETSAELCTRKQRGSVVYYDVNTNGQKKAQEVARAVIQRIGWIKQGLAPDDDAGRDYKLLL